MIELVEALAAGGAWLVVAVVLGLLVGRALSVAEAGAGRSVAGGAELLEHGGGDPPP